MPYRLDLPFEMDASITRGHGRRRVAQDGPDDHCIYPRLEEEGVQGPSQDLRGDPEGKLGDVGCLGHGLYQRLGKAMPPVCRRKDQVPGKGDLPRGLEGFSLMLLQHRLEPLG